MNISNFAKLQFPSASSCFSFHESMRSHDRASQPQPQPQEGLRPGGGCAHDVPPHAPTNGAQTFSTTVGLLKGMEQNTYQPAQILIESNCSFQEKKHTQPKFGPYSSLH